MKRLNQIVHEIHRDPDARSRPLTVGELKKLVKLATIESNERIEEHRKDGREDVHV